MRTFNRAGRRQVITNLGSPRAGYFVIRVLCSFIFRQMLLENYGLTPFRLLAGDGGQSAHASGDIDGSGVELQGDGAEEEVSCRETNFRFHPFNFQLGLTLFSPLLPLVWSCPWQGCLC